MLFIIQGYFVVCTCEHMNMAFQVCLCLGARKLKITDLESISKLAASSLTFSPSVLSLSASIYQPIFREQLNTCCSNNTFYFTLCTALSFSQSYCQLGDKVDPVCKTVCGLPCYVTVYELAAVHPPVSHGNNSLMNVRSSSFKFPKENLNTHIYLLAIWCNLV